MTIKSLPPQISHLRKAQNYPYEVRAQRGDWVEESIINGRTDPNWDSATRSKFKREWDTYVNEVLFVCLYVCVSICLSVFV